MAKWLYMSYYHHLGCPVISRMCRNDFIAITALKAANNVPCILCVWAAILASRVLSTYLKSWAVAVKWRTQNVCRTGYFYVCDI